MLPCIPVALFVLYGVTKYYFGDENHFLNILSEIFLNTGSLSAVVFPVFMILFKLPFLKFLEELKGDIKIKVNKESILNEIINREKIQKYSFVYEKLAQAKSGVGFLISCIEKDILDLVRNDQFEKVCAEILHFQTSYYQSKLFISKDFQEIIDQFDYKIQFFIYYITYCEKSESKKEWESLRKDVKTIKDSLDQISNNIDCIMKNDCSIN